MTKIEEQRPIDTPPSPPVEQILHNPLPEEREEKISLTSPLCTMHNFEIAVKQAFREFRTTNRELRSDEISRLHERAYQLQDQHRTKGMQYMLPLIGAAFGIVSGPFDPTVAKSISSVGDVFSTAGQSMIQFTEGELSLMQNHMQELHESLTQANRTNSEIDEILRDVHSLLRDASSRTVEAFKTSALGG